MKWVLPLLVIFFVFRHGESWTYKVINKAEGRLVIMVQLTDVNFLWIELNKKGLKLRELVKS